MKILLVGGTFDNNGGKSSSLISKMENNIIDDNVIELSVYNGGFVEDLHNKIIKSVTDYDIVMWFANVSNGEIKERDVKAINPKTILITSKRNDNNKYTFAELISRSLSIKANLTIEFSKIEDKLFNMMVFDPLGNMFYNGTDIEKMTVALMKRAKQLTKFTRKPTIKSTENKKIIVPNEEKFFNFAHDCADIFHNLIRPAKNTDRFLGNMSFRCQNGFPSFRGDDGMIFVSRRNVDKGTISAESFVPTYLDENEDVIYFGDNKPSVDTPVQLRLYDLFPWVNYMLHAHCYIQPSAELPDTSFHTTYIPVPCGAIEEVKEVVLATHSNFPCEEYYQPRLIAVNLIGHGCILMASDVEVFDELRKYKDFCFKSRPMPEETLSMFKSEVMQHIDCEDPTIAFDEYFNNEVFSLQQFEDIMLNSKEVTSKTKSYYEFGSMYCGSEHIYTMNNKNKITRMALITLLIEAYNLALNHSPNRIFVHNSEKYCHVLILRRDIDKEDIYIYITK